MNDRQYGIWKLS